MTKWRFESLNVVYNNERNRDKDICVAREENWFEKKLPRSFKKGTFCCQELSNNDICKYAIIRMLSNETRKPGCLKHFAKTKKDEILLG